MNFKNSRILIGAAILLATMGSCKNTEPKGIDTANLDTSVSPKDDFYDYACGGWMKANPLKAEYSRFGTFDQLAENNRQQVQDLVLNLNPNAPKGSNEQKVADLYAMGMDSVRLNEEGIQPIIEDLATIAAAEREDIVNIMATMPGVDVFFGTGVSSDPNDSKMNTMYWGQGGLGLGDRDYYTDQSERGQKIREAYYNYLQSVAILADYDAESAKRLADNCMAVETALASKQLTRTEQRDVEATTNPMAVAELAAKYPAIDIVKYFAAQGLDVDTMIVDSPAYYAAAADVIANTDIQALRDYIAASYISSAARYLSDDFRDAQFELSKVMSGVQEQQPRWKRALSVPNGFLGEAIGQLYVEKYFPESSKEKMTTLVKNLQTALGQHIDQLTWMSDTTKAKAHEKLNTFHVKIGYPDKWKDYSDLEIDPELPYWKNIQNAILFNLKKDNEDYGKPVDVDRWYMSPQTVNAYYNPPTNEICFPAGILQPPFFDPTLDDACNYGAIGVVIGHEMTHGFDDQGRLYDKDGNQANWWTEADAQAFNELAQKLVEQFNQVVISGDTHANGQLTLGENIADQGGLRVAHTAYLNSLNGSEGPVIDGFSPDQRFYLAYANVWAGNIREDEMLQRTISDPHSLGRWRVNATLKNIAPFMEAFQISENDPMFRPEEERVIIW